MILEKTTDLTRSPVQGALAMLPRSPLGWGSQGQTQLFQAVSVIVVHGALSPESRREMLSMSSPGSEWPQGEGTGHPQWAGSLLPAEEAGAVHEALIKLEADSDEKIQMTKLFLNTFPPVKKKMQEHIAKLYALAARIDKVHKDCTITKVVARSSGALSGILTILGIALAPVTAGGSLVLSATGLGLGAAATVTGISASIVDHATKFLAKAKARHLLSSTVVTKNDVLRAVQKDTPKVRSATKKCVETFQSIKKNVCAFKMAKSNPRLLDNAYCFMKTEKISVQSGKQVQKVFGDTVLAMSKGARLTSAAIAGFFTLVEVFDLVKDSMHLHKGAKTKSAAELRQKAQVLEGKLEELTQNYESLHSFRLPKTPSPVNAELSAHGHFKHLDEDRKSSRGEKMVR
ncbi:apolipoprotein L2-like isoform X2 [Cavia porcellus]